MTTTTDQLMQFDNDAAQVRITLEALLSPNDALVLSYRDSIAVLRMKLIETLNTTGKKP